MGQSDFGVSSVLQPQAEDRKRDIPTGPDASPRSAPRFLHLPSPNSTNARKLWRVVPCVRRCLTGGAVSKYAATQDKTWIRRFFLN